MGFEILLRTARLCRLPPQGRKKEDKVVVTLAGESLHYSRPLSRDSKLGSFSAPERSALPLATAGTQE